MMGARELLPVFFSYCRRMLRAFLLVALGGATGPSPAQSRYVP